MQEALLKAAAAHPNITMLPGRACIDLITGRNAERFSGDGHVWGAYALDEAKRDAGMALGNTGGKNGIKKQLCRARIVSKEKDARRMENRLHMQQAKARAAGEFFVAKLRKAHEAAKLVSAQNSQHSKKFRLEVSLNATLSANEARQDSVKARANVDKLASHAEDASMDARRVADECAAVLGPVSRLEQDPDAKDPDLKGLSKDDGKPEEEHPSMEASMRAQQKAAVASLNKALGTPGVKGMTEAGKWMQQQQQEEKDETGTSGASGESGSTGAAPVAAPVVAVAAPCKKDEPKACEEETPDPNPCAAKCAARCKREAKHKKCKCGCDDLKEPAGGSGASGDTGTNYLFNITCFVSFFKKLFSCLYLSCNSCVKLFLKTFI